MFSFAASLAARICGLPAVIKVGSTSGNDDYESLIRLRLEPFKNIAAKHIRTRPVIIATTHDMISNLKQNGFREKNIVQIPNGVLVGRERKEKYDLKEPVHIVSVGFVMRSKGYQDVIESICNITESKFEYDVYGRVLEDDYNEYLKGKIEESEKCGNAIKLNGQIDRNDLMGIVRSADIMIVSSYYEGMSNALLEAMEAGIPCISTLVSGAVDLLCPEIGNIDEFKPGMGEHYAGKCGIVINIGDVAGMTGAIRELLGSKELRERIGKNARNRIVDEYSIELIAERYLKLYRDMKPAKNP